MFASKNSIGEKLIMKATDLNVYNEVYVENIPTKTLENIAEKIRRKMDVMDKELEMVLIELKRRKDGY